MSYSEDSSFESDEDFVTNPTECRTENGALSYATTGDGRIHLFYKTIRGINENKLTSYLNESWQEDPLDTLKMIFFIRDVRGNGKGEKKIFQQGFKWLMDTHPEAVRHSATHIPFYGSYKDWLEIFLGTRYEKSMLKAFAKQLIKDFELVKATFDSPDTPTNNTTTNNATTNTGYFSFLWKNTTTNNTTTTTTNQENKPNISLAWKWAPTENTHYDKGPYAGTVQKLCKLMGISKKIYRKTATTIRSHLGIVEGLMCGKKWEDIDFSKVPSRAMHIYKKAYSRHQPERFSSHINKVITGEAKINTGTLQPHEIVNQALSQSGSDPAVEAQWKCYVDQLVASGVNLDGCVSVVDTSGSMFFHPGTAGKVAYALGLLTAQLCTGPFHNKWIEFSSHAKIHEFPNGTLHEKINSIRSIVENTNIQAVFDTILATYRMFNVTPENQIKRCFIFTDGQWDSMTSNSNLTNFEAIDKKFQDGGFTRPDLVFWNLQANTVDYPCPGEAKGTVMMSGFSSDLLKLFLDGGDLSPINLVLKAVRDPRYDRIKL